MIEENRSRLVAVSNRLPVVFKSENGGWTTTPGSGGLITAMAPVLKNRGGLWIGWPGAANVDGLEKLLRSASADAGYELKPVELSEDEIKGFYYGFANEILWPLFHGFETRCNFDPAYWQDYKSANQKFAKAVAATCRERDFVWIHDYHLSLVGSELRKMGCGYKLGFFLHIPFPPPDVFFKLPWRAQLLEGLLAFDLVGFQTVRDRRNFTSCLHQLKLAGLKISGTGSVVSVSFRGRNIRVGAFPISIDFAEISHRAASGEVAEKAWLFHEHFPERQIIIGMDRLDYTKGIPERLEAFRIALKTHPELQGKATLVQVTVPSREDVPEYRELRLNIERIVGEINGEFTIPGEWVPIHYIHRSLMRDEVYSYLRASDVALVTPLRDGMNLVAKEFCACDIDLSGALVLSEFAGAAAELNRGALLVNPYDVEGMAAAIYRAFKMNPAERRERMRKMREQIRKHDIFHWVNSVLEAAFAVHLADLPLVEEFIPRLDIAAERRAVPRA